MTSRSALQNVSVVLVDTKTPANIGAVARVMMNMGLTRLVLVAPPDDPREEAKKLAAGAAALLDRAAVFPSLTEAVADQRLVVGTSRHRGRLRKNVFTPRDAAARIVPLLPNPVALVFGNEINGLTGSELALCHEFIAIPTSDDFPSLNLSHAVMVTAYELFIACGAPRIPEPVRLAEERDLENFYRHLQTTLQDISFLDRDHPERMMFSLRQLFSRARPDARDVKILRGILTAVDKLQKK